MFLPKRLAKLSPAHRLRKAGLLLHEVEVMARGADLRAAAGAMSYSRELAAFLATDGDSPGSVRQAAAALVSAVDGEAAADSGAPQPGLSPGPGAGPSLAGEALQYPAARASAIRALNNLRHILVKEGGQAPADWDFLDPATGRPDPGARRPYPGMVAFLEDIRSPFNVGSMFRSAEAFGIEELVLSPGCADPGHPRAFRSAMGAIDLVPWRRAALAELLGQDGPEALPAFALELGGTPLGSFEFPERGIVVVGSEELGVSQEALGRCALGKVSIPMVGAKGSLNVGVAFGIVLSAWAGSLARRQLFV